MTQTAPLPRNESLTRSIAQTPDTPGQPRRAVIRRVQVIDWEGGRWVWSSSACAPRVRVDLGAAKSWDLVGKISELAWYLTEAQYIELVGNDERALAYVEAELPAALDRAIEDATPVEYAPDDPRHWGGA